MAKSIFTFTLYLSCMTLAICQSAITTQGDFVKKSDCSLSWTIGELAIDTFSENGTHITQGINQVEFIVTGLNQEDDLYSINIYPNPVSEVLKISLKNRQSDETYILIDIKGSIIKQAEFNDIDVSIDFSKYPSGMYILKIGSSEKSEINSYKIQKIK